MKSFGQKVIAYNRNLKYEKPLPQGFKVLNPYLDNPETMEVMSQFYDKYYSDQLIRRLILGINPGRLGAGTTGVPFTDTKKLREVCGIQMTSVQTHEVSAIFVYDMIAAYGGATSFYRDFYINSIFPLAIVRKTKTGWLNANYYDDKNLFESVEDFMIQSVKDHIRLGIDTSEVFVWGKKNAAYFEKINKQGRLFDKVTVLEHPRYIQQYKTKQKKFYIQKYLQAFHQEKEHFTV